MAELTFRDFAGAVMGTDRARAAEVLAALLKIDANRANAAVEHFMKGMAAGGPGFMGKAMGLRAAVTSGSDDDVRALLRDCFGLEGAAAETALGALRPSA